MLNVGSDVNSCKCHELRSLSQDVTAADVTSCGRGLRKGGLFQQRPDVWGKSPCPVKETPRGAVHACAVFLPKTRLAENDCKAKCATSPEHRVRARPASPLLPAPVPPPKVSRASLPQRGTREVPSALKPGHSCTCMCAQRTSNARAISWSASHSMLERERGGEPLSCIMSHHLCAQF